MKCLKCLIVDDEKDICDCFADILEMNGHEVTKVSSKDSAIEVLMSRQFDVIVTDNDMPEVHMGLEVVRQARIQNPNAIIWMASGRMDHALRHAAKARGANDGFLKTDMVAKLVEFSLEQSPMVVI